MDGLYGEEELRLGILRISRAGIYFSFLCLRRIEQKRHMKRLEFKTFRVSFNQGVEGGKDNHLNGIF